MSSLGGMGWGKRSRNESQSDRAENHHQNRLYLSLFDVEKVRFFIKNALWLYSELCFLCRRGAQFQKFHENKWSEIEKWDPSRVGDVKILPKWGRIHGDVVKRMLDTSFKSPKEATCSRNAHICNVF